MTVLAQRFVVKDLKLVMTLSVMTETKSMEMDVIVNAKLRKDSTAKEEIRSRPTCVRTLNL